MRFAFVAGLVVLACAATSACEDIVSRRRSTAPLNASNEFPCDRYGVAGVVPQDGRCVVNASTATYPFTIVVNAPESSLYAAGHTFVLQSSDTSNITVFGGERRVKLPVIGTVIGAYTVKNTVSKRELGTMELPDATSIPVRAVYTPIGRDDKTPYSAALPLDVVFASSRVDDNESPRVAYVRSLPAGSWLRSFEPAPPWDAIFPPHIAGVRVQRTGNQIDLVDIGGLNGDFDDLGGTSRDARISRSEGLEGWTVFLRDRASQRRISTLKTLCVAAPDCAAVPTPANCCSATHAEANARLDTVGRGTLIDENGAVEGVLAPPPGWVATPTLAFELTNGCCLNFRYPDLMPPVAVEGVVAASADAGLFVAVASRVTLESETITLPGAVAESRLRYSTTVSTDDLGRFETVVPPGTYRVTVQPLEGTGFASFRTQKVIEDDDPLDDTTRTRITLLPPRRTRVRGAAVLTDGRPAANAEVLALAEPLVDATAQPTPRPARTTVGADGAFALDLDQGAYVLTVVPEAGTGFPRVVARTTIPPDQADVGVVRIPPPTRLGLQIIEAPALARAIPFANVRIFAAPEGGGGPLLEIGSGMTNADGRVEILLAPQPK